jgi:hypothetical protein
MLLQRLEVVLGPPLMPDAARLEQRLDLELESLLEARVGVADEPQE